MELILPDLHPLAMVLAVHDDVVRFRLVDYFEEFLNAQINNLELILDLLLPSAPLFVLVGKCF